MKKVSIIIPLYKSAKYMVKMVDSILNQTYSNIELILVDDESPDESGTIADKYAAKDARVHVIHKKNQGCCGARNAGLQVASGDYLMFADGDDWLELDCVEYLVSLAEKNDCQMSMTDAIFTTRDQIQNSSDNIRVWSKEEAVCGILYAEIPIGPWNKLYSMRVVREHNLSFSVPWFGEGLYFSAMNAQYSNQVAVGHRKVYNYRLNNPNSGTTVREVQHGINALQNIKNIKDKLVVRTRNTLNSADWHIAYNCYYLMTFIIWSNTGKEYADLYKSTQKELHRLVPGVVLRSKVRLWQKVFLVVACIAPKTLARMIMHRKKRRFKADTME